MDDKMERWTVTSFDDAAAQVTLPPRERWLPADRRAKTSLPTLVLTAAAVALTVGIALWLVADGRIVPAAPSANPAPSNAIPLTPGTPGASEAQTWGKVWSISQGATILRPSWLPATDFDTSYDVVTTTRFYRYMVGYYPKNFFPLGARPWRFLFIAEGPDVVKSRPGFGESSTNVTVRGQIGELITATDGGLRVVWMENEIRYTIQAAVGIPASDILRVAESLVPVNDGEGNTR
jgi:hypothetical protein